VPQTLCGPASIGVAMPRVFELIAVVSALLSLSFQVTLAQTENQAQEGRRIIVESFVISGTRTVDSVELAEITNSMAGSTFSDDSEELEERIRAQFQDRGYFQAEVKHVDIKAIDPLASPKPVRMQAEVSEGPRCRTARIEFKGNHAFSAEDLRVKFTIKIGDPFARSKIAAGLESMRNVYGSHGYLDEISIPDTELDSSAAVKLSVEVHEGPQYRMDKLEILGPAEVAEKLQARWELAPGTVFDATYVEKFLEENSSLLPADFIHANGVELFKDCNDRTVTVHLHLTPDPQHAALDRAKHVDCPPEEKKIGTKPQT
jgi:outer membrane protein assembly factor BamA